MRQSTAIRKALLATSLVYGRSLLSPKHSGTLCNHWKWNVSVCISQQAFIIIDIRLRPGRARNWRHAQADQAGHATPSRPITAKRDVIHKTGSTYRSATPPEEDRGTSTGDPQTEFRADRSSGSTICSRQTDTQTDRQTHRHTDWSQYSAPLPEWSNNTTIQMLR